MASAGRDPSGDDLAGTAEFRRSTEADVCIVPGHRTTKPRQAAGEEELTGTAEPADLDKLGSNRGGGAARP